MFLFLVLCLLPGRLYLFPPAGFFGSVKLVDVLFQLDFGGRFGADDVVQLYLPVFGNRDALGFLGRRRGDRAAFEEFLDGLDNLF